MIKKLFFIFYPFIAFFLIIIDQFYKYKIRSTGGFYICNYGISFGLPINNTFFWLIYSLFFITFLAFFYHLKNKALLEPLFLLSFILITSGVLSNAFDRLLEGCVIDFININFLFFPIFNLADILIFIGTLFLFLFLFKKDSTFSL